MYFIKSNISVTNQNYNICALHFALLPTKPSHVQQTVFSTSILNYIRQYLFINEFNKKAKNYKDVLLVRLVKLCIKYVYSGKKLKLHPACRTV